jgi:hypothetical protein
MCKAIGSSLLVTLFLFAVAPGSPGAPPVRVTGRLHALVVAPPCAPSATHALDDVGVYVRSSTVNLAPLVGANVSLTGSDLGAAGCPLVDVAQAVFSGFTLSVCGSVNLGCFASLDLCPTPGNGTFLIFAAPAPGYVPVTVATGTLLLDPLAFLPIVTGTQGAVCQANPIQLLGPPSLVGMDVWLQAALLPAAGAPQLSNAAHFVIEPPIATPCPLVRCF